VTGIPILANATMVARNRLVEGVRLQVAGSRWRDRRNRSWPIGNRHRDRSDRNTGLTGRTDSGKSTFLDLRSLIPVPRSPADFLSAKASPLAKPPLAKRSLCDIPDP